MSNASPGAGGTPNQIQTTNIADLANNPNWTGSLAYEDPNDKKHRLDQEAAENQHKRWRATTLFGLALLALIAIFVFAIGIIRDQSTTQEDKKWATAVMTSITTGLIGFATGKAIA